MSILNQEVAELIHKKVHLKILRRTLDWDRYHLQQTKMKRIYHQLLDHVLEGISEELQNINKQLKHYQVRIIREEQRENERFVVYQHRGYLFEKQYLNPLIKMECEKLLKTYLKL